MLRAWLIPVGASLALHAVAGVALVVWGLGDQPPRIAIPEGEAAHETRGVTIRLLPSEAVVTSTAEQTAEVMREGPSAVPAAALPPIVTDTAAVEHDVTFSPLAADITPLDLTAADVLAHAAEPMPRESNDRPVEHPQNSAVFTRHADALDASLRSAWAGLLAARRALARMAARADELPATSDPVSPPPDLAAASAPAATTEASVHPPTDTARTPARSSSSKPAVSEPGVAHGPVPLSTNTPPRYPDECRRRRQQGAALVHVVIEADGGVSGLSLARSSGVGLLDQAALEAVRSWRFTPARAGGVNVRSEADVPVVFVLRE